MFSSVTAISTIFYNSASLFVLSRQHLFHVFDFSFTAVPTASAEISLHFPFGLEMSHVSCELCPPSPPAGCCHRDIVFPYHSLPCHLCLFSVMARFKTAVVFLTFDCLPILWEEHEDERETRCMVSESKDAASSDDCSHSSLLSSLSSSSSEGQGPKLPLFIHPSISLFTLHFLCVLCRIVATDHVLGVCSPPNGRDIAPTIAMLTTSWYFLKRRRRREGEGEGT